MVKSNSIDLARRVGLAVALGVLTLGVGLVLIQTAAAQDADEELQLLSSEALTELVGPIALYPDDLVAIVLPASTYPLQVVQAARFLEERESNSSLTPDEDWDDSVVALLNYPEVVKLMNDDLDWTWQLGEAVLNQRAEVLDAVQDFRDRAYAAGNLRSDERQVVNNDDGVIEIEPADPEVIYVPYYEPERVIVYQPRPVYYYHPWAYPVYYYPYPVGYSFHSFHSPFFWGVTSAFTIGWHSHFLHVHHHGFHSHPYFGWRYYDPFYVRSGININVNINRGNVWEPRYHRAARPFARSTGRRVAGAVSSNVGSRDLGQYRPRTSAPESRTFTFTRAPQQRAPSNADSNSGRRNPSVERQQRQAVGRTPSTAPRATARTQPRIDANRNAGSTVRQPSESAPSQNASRQRTGGGMSQALEGAQPRYNVNRAVPNAGTAARVPDAGAAARVPNAGARLPNSNSGAVARPNVSRSPQSSAPRASGGVTSGGQRGYRSEAGAPSNSGARSAPRGGNQSQPVRGTRSSGRQSSR